MQIKLSSDSTALYRYIFPFLTLSFNGVLLFFIIKDYIILLPIIIFLWPIAFFLGRFHLIFKINDVYINYENSTFEVHYSKHKESILFTDLKDIREDMLIITLKFANKKIHYARKWESEIFNRTAVTMGDLHAIINANRLGEE